MDEIDKLVEERLKSRASADFSAETLTPIEKFDNKLGFQLDEKKPYAEQAKEYVGVRATETAIADEELARNITDRKKAEIMNFAEASLKKEEAENKKADILLQEANYGVYNGVATYAGIKKPLPQRMQGILFTILSIIQTILLIAIGLPISAINIIADSVDSVVKKLETLTHSARWIVIGVIIAGLLYVLLIIIKSLLASRGIILW